MDSFWASRQSAEARDGLAEMALNLMVDQCWSWHFVHFPHSNGQNLGSHWHHAPLRGAWRHGQEDDFAKRLKDMGYEACGLGSKWPTKLDGSSQFYPKCPNWFWIYNYLWIMVLIPSMARIIIQSKPCGSMLILRMTSRSCGSCFWQSRRGPFWCQRRHASPNHH